MKILIGYDGSESSEAAIEDLLRAGLPTQAEARVIAVADVFLPPAQNDSDEVFPTLPEVRRAQERAERKVQEAGLRARRASEEVKKHFPGWQVDHESFADSPAWALIRKADEWKPDLLVVGAHGHSVLGGRLILGSVSQRVLYETKCSVRIARGKGKSADAPVRILIGVDGSSHCHATVDTVSKRQWPKGSEVRLVAVVDTVMPMALDPNDQSIVKWVETDETGGSDIVRELFEPSAEKLRSAGLKVEIVVRRGKPKDELVEEAESQDVDNIFLGAKGMRGIERLLLGSVSAAVAATAPCSVEIVRPKQ